MNWQRRSNPESSLRKSGKQEGGMRLKFGSHETMNPQEIPDLLLLSWLPDSNPLKISAENSARRGVETNTRAARAPRI